MATDNLKELGEALLKNPVDIEKIVQICNDVFNDHNAVLDNIEVIIKKAGLTQIEACKAAGINKQQYYRRIADKDLWKREELAGIISTIAKQKKRK